MTASCFIWLEPVSDRSGSLTPSERARWARYRHASDRDRFSTGADLQRRALREMCGVDVPLERQCPSCHAADHGPVRPGGGYASQWTLSLSHSGRFAMVGIAPAPSAIGVDIELATRRYDRVSALAFSAAERARDRADGAGPTEWTRRWCRKEAVLKATRRGVSLPMSSLEVSSATEPARVMAWADGPPDLDLQGVRLFDVEPAHLPHGYVAAVAAVGTQAMPWEIVVAGAAVGG